MVRVISGVSGVLRFLSLATIVPAFIALAFIVPAPVGVLQPTPAQAQTCGSDYTIKEGETLDWLAAKEYGSAAQWRFIAEVNQIDDPSRLKPGTVISLPPLP